jgi:hypothetical protein
MMRGDAVSRSTYLRNRFNTASISPNGIKIYEGENPSKDEGSDSLYIQGAMVPLSMAGKINKQQPTGGTVQ